MEKRVCDRCGKEFNAVFDNGGNCPVCGDELCAECAMWFETNEYSVCAMCVNKQMVKVLDYRRNK